MLASGVPGKAGAASPAWVRSAGDSESPAFGKRRVLGAGVPYLLQLHTSLNPRQPQGLICTWPASPGLEGCRQGGDSGKGRNEVSQ